MAITKRFDRALIVGRAMQRWRPATGIEDAQGEPYFNQPGVLEALQMPADPGINLRGFLNPYKMSSYLVGPILTTNPIIALPGNLRRTYLMIQNNGPGNLYINFGTDAGVGICHQLIQTQFYEQIGGGFYDYESNHSRAGCFVTRDYLSMISDNSTTTAIVSEGIWNFVQQEYADRLQELQERMNAANEHPGMAGLRGR